MPASPRAIVSLAFAIACKNSDCPEGFLRDNDGNCVETGDADADTDADSDADNGPAPRIEAYDADCFDDVTFHASIDTRNATNGVAIMNIWELEKSGQSEEHEMLTTSSDAFGERLELTLTSFDTTQWWCDLGSGEFENGNPFNKTLAFTIRVYDTSDQFSDCVMFGHMEECIVDGTCPNGIGNPSNEDELASCSYRASIF